MKNAKITMGISLPNNLHAMVDGNGNFSRLLKVNSKINFLEYIGLLNEIYEKQAKEEEYKQKIIDIDYKRKLKKKVDKIVFLILLLVTIITFVFLNITSNILTISNFFKFLGFVLADFIITNVGVNIFLGSNKTLDKHVKYYENQLKKTRNEKKKLLSLCKAKEQEFEISEISFDGSERIDNSVNRSENHKEKWYADIYKEEDKEIMIYRMAKEEEFLLPSIEKYYYDSLNRNIVNKLANKEGDVELPVKDEFSQDRIPKIIKKLEEEQEKVFIKKRN